MKIVQGFFKGLFLKNYLAKPYGNKNLHTSTVLQGATMELSLFYYNRGGQVHVRGGKSKVAGLFRYFTFTEKSSVLLYFTTFEKK